MNTFNIAIVGGGPAGVAAAMQLSRMGTEPLLFESGQIGGLLVNANLVENYPGLDQPLSGIGLAEKLERQLNQSGTRIIAENVAELDYREGRFYLKTAKMSYPARTVLLATGTKPRKISDLNIPQNAQDLVYSEVYPLLGISGMDIVIVGAGDAAFDYALNLGRKNRVTILNRSRRTKCLRLLYDRVHAHDRVLTTGRISRS